MSNKQKILLRLIQLIPAIILGYTAFTKLSNQPVEVYIFTQLEMEPIGRYIIGVIELLSSLFLFTDFLAALGGLLGISTMLGAIIAHISILGVSIRGDNGIHILLLCVVLFTCCFITYVRKKQIPLIGNTL